MTSPTIWYVHPYAGGPGIGRYSRPYYLSHHWNLLGARATVITASNHHLLDHPQEPGRRTVDGVEYRFLPVPSYSGNGLSRVRNMLAFGIELWRSGDKLVEAHGKPDMIIASSPHPFAFLATHRLARRFGAASVFEVRDLWPLSLVELAGASPHHPFVVATGMLERFAYRHADATVALLPASQEHMCARGLDPRRWHYIPNGIDARERDGATVGSEPLEQLATWHAAGKLVVLYAGAIGPPNNLESLVRAAAHLKSRRNDDVKFLIVGGGPLSQSLKILVRDLDLSEQVAIFPQIPKAAACTLMRNSDIGFISLLNRSIFRFGVSPNKLFDYMLNGLPVIFAINAGNDIVRDSGCGFTVPPDDPAAIAEAIARLAAMSKSQRAEMGKHGMDAVIKDHDYGSLAERYLGVLRSLGKSKP